MARIPNAAKQLVNNVQDFDSDAYAEPFGDPDGLNTRRTLAFDPKTSKWLEGALETLADPRIQRLDHDGSGKDKRLLVTFVADTRADRTAFFDVEAAKVVSEGKAKATKEPVKKAAAKKADQ